MSIFTVGTFCTEYERDVKIQMSAKMFYMLHFYLQENQKTP